MQLVERVMFKYTVLVRSFDPIDCTGRSECVPVLAANAGNACTVAEQHVRNTCPDQHVTDSRVIEVQSAAPSSAA